MSMKLFHSKTWLLVIVLGVLVLAVEDKAQTPKKEIHMDGLSQSVDIIKDIWVEIENGERRGR